MTPKTQTVVLEYTTERRKGKQRDWTGAHRGQFEKERTKKTGTFEAWDRVLKEVGRVGWRLIQSIE